MSFFKKLTQEFDTLTSSFGDKKDENPAQSHGGGGQRDYRKLKVTPILRLGLVLIVCWERLLSLVFATPMWRLP